MRRAILLAALAALAVALGGGPAPSVAAERASQTEIEGEVMCPICGTLLGLADSPQARREKAFIARMVAADRTREQIKAALVAEYGEEVLALPPRSGFDLSAYLVPIVALAIAAIALALAVLRWRRRPGGDGEGDEQPPVGPSAEDAARLEADLARYDL